MIFAPKVAFGKNDILSKKFFEGITPKMMEFLVKISMLKEFEIR